MLRTRRLSRFLYRITLLAWVLPLLTSTMVEATEELSVEVPGETVPNAIDEGRTADGRQEEEEAAAPPPDVMAPPMMTPSQAPPTYDPGKYDWIRLTSGEWLKGDIIVLRDKELEFDSDEMDEQKFDWKDVAEVRSSRKYTYVLKDRTAFVGTALVWEDKIVIGVNGEERVLERSDLMSIVPSGERERDRWDGKGSLGLAFRRGNTDQADLTYQGYIRRRDANTRTRLDVNGSIGQVEGVQNVNNHRSLLKFDLFLSPSWYVTPAAVTAYYDRFQNISLRLTPAAGVGYHAIDTNDITCDLELGGGFRYTRYRTVEAGTSEETDSGTVIPTIRIETEPLKDVDFDVLYTAQVGVPDADETTMHGEAILSVELTDLIDLDIAFIWDRVQSPKPNEDGSVPKKDDAKLTVSLGIEF